MPPPAKHRRSDWRHFPQAYIELCDRLATTPSLSLGPMSPADAASARRELYRFKMFLIAAMDEGDEVAGEIGTRLNNTTIRIRVDPTDPTRTWLDLSPNSVLAGLATLDRHRPTPPAPLAPPSSAPAPVRAPPPLNPIEAAMLWGADEEERTKT